MNNGTDDYFYVGHTDFVLTKLGIERLETNYGSSSIPFVELVVNISLARRTNFFYYMYILPANILLFTVPLVHLIPPGKESKFIICKLTLESLGYIVVSL